MRLVLTVFLISALASTEARASGGPAFMGLMLAIAGLFAFFVLIALIAGVATIFSPKHNRAKAFSSNLVKAFVVAVVSSIIDFLVFNTSHSTDNAPLPLYAEFLITFFQGLIFGRILIEMILVTTVVVIVKTIRARGVREIS
jgi:hypothetical protein